MTFVPSIVAPMAMPTREMTMPMPVPNFMTGGPWSGAPLSCSAASALERRHGAVAGGAAHERERARWSGAGRASWRRARTRARRARRRATASGVSVTSSREPVVSVTTVSGLASTVQDEVGVQVEGVWLAGQSVEADHAPPGESARARRP